MKCEKCGNEKSWIEVIEKGIKQTIVYEDDYIVEETTCYDKDKDGCYAKCGVCNTVYTEYEL